MFLPVFSRFFSPLDVQAKEFVLQAKEFVLQAKQFVLLYDFAAV